MKQPEVGDEVFVALEVGGVIKGKLAKCNVDWLTVDFGGRTLDINPDKNKDVSVGPLRAGEWEYAR